MPPDKQPHSQSFNKHVNISHALKQDLSKHENKTVRHPPVYSFVFNRSDLECCSPCEQETDGAMSFYWSKKPGRQSRPLRAVEVWSLYKHAASMCVSCSLSCFQVSRQKGAGSRQLLRKPFLKELGSTVLLCWPAECSHLEIMGEWKEEREDTYVTPRPPPKVTRSVTQEALELHYPLLTAD